MRHAAIVSYINYCWKELSMKGKNSCPYAIEGFVGCFLPFRSVYFFGLRLSVECVVPINVWLFGVLEHAVPYISIQTNDSDNNDEETNSHRVCEWFALCFENWERANEREEKNGGKMKKKKRNRNSSSLSSSIDHTVHSRFYRKRNSRETQVCGKYMHAFHFAYWAQF